jgi:DNA-binding NarL/FixJ family response regulator
MNERILIADDHYVVRAGTALVLESAYPGLTIDFAEDYEQVKKCWVHSSMDFLSWILICQGPNIKR